VTTTVGIIMKDTGTRELMVLTKTAIVAPTARIPYLKYATVMDYRVALELVTVATG